MVETERLKKPGESAVPPFIRARKQPRQVEHYWLCDSCAAQWTLVYDQHHGIGLTPLPRPATNAGMRAAATHSGAA